MITVPESLALQLVRDNDNERAERWIDDLPFLAQDILGAWDCQPDGEIRAGAVAVVIPVSSPMGPAVVKISYPLRGNADELRTKTSRSAVNSWPASRSRRRLV